MEQRVSIIGVDNIGTKKIKARIRIMTHLPLAPIRRSANFVLNSVAAKARREIRQDKNQSSHKRSRETRGEFLPQILEKKILCDAVDGTLDKMPTIGTTS